MQIIVETFKRERHSSPSGRENSTKSDANNLCLMFFSGYLNLYYRYNYTVLRKCCTIADRIQLKKIYPPGITIDSAPFFITDEKRISDYNDPKNGYKIYTEKMIQDIHRVSCSKMLPVSISMSVKDVFGLFSIDITNRFEISEYN